MLLIPTSESPHYLQTTELEGKTYGLEFYWNTRDLAWYLTIWDSAFQTRLLAGRKLVINGQVLGRFPRDIGLPPGEITEVDLGGTGVEAGLKEIGQRVVVSYLTEAEMPA